jgi:hypothetical protein
MRNGSATSHTSGARTSTASATGHDKTSKMHQRTRRTRNLTFARLCALSASNVRASPAALRQLPAPSGACDVRRRVRVSQEFLRHPAANRLVARCMARVSLVAKGPEPSIQRGISFDGTNTSIERDRPAIRLIKPWRSSVRIPALRPTTPKRAPVRSAAYVNAPQALDSRLSTFRRARSSREQFLRRPRRE